MPSPLLVPLHCSLKKRSLISHDCLFDESFAIGLLTTCLFGCKVVFYCISSEEGDVPIQQSGCARLPKSADSPQIEFKDLVFERERYIQVCRGDSVCLGGLQVLRGLTAESRKQCPYLTKIHQLPLQVRSNRFKTVTPRRVPYRDG